MEKKWTQVKFIADRTLEEEIYSILYQLDVTAIEVEDYRDVEFFKKTQPNWVIMDEDFGIKSDNVIIKTAYENDDVLKEKLDFIIEKTTVLKAKNPGIVLSLSTDTEIEGTDWANEWKKFFKPTKIGESIVIKPTWEDYLCNANELVIELDPGMAFGTGTHETTALCIEALERQDVNNKLVLDIGCGSGILSIAASKLGAKSVIAVDIDELSIDATIENASLNNCNNVTTVHGDLLEKIDTKSDIIMANILAEVLSQIIPDLPRFLNTMGVVILSGIIVDKKDLVINSLVESGFKVIEINQRKDWVEITAQIQYV